MEKIGRQLAKAPAAAANQLMPDALPYITWRQFQAAFEPLHITEVNGKRPSQWGKQERWAWKGNPKDFVGGAWKAPLRCLTRCVFSFVSSVSKFRHVDHLQDPGRAQIQLLWQGQTKGCYGIGASCTA
jgi:hypothetical protein